MAWICRHPISNSTDAVDTLAALGLFRGDGEAQLFLERAGEGAAHRVRLPAGGHADLVDGGPLRALQHLDHRGLLAVLAGAGFALDTDLKQSLGRVLFFLRPVALCGRHGGLDLGVGVDGGRRRPGAPQGVVALGRDEPGGAVASDQGLVE